MIDLKIFTNNIDENAIEQINILMQQSTFKDCKVRIMPDVHHGKGCVIGFTSTYKDKIIPNIVGVDLNCAMLCVKLNEKNLDLQELDNVIRMYIPSGKNAHSEKQVDFDLTQLYCYSHLKNIEHIENSIGTLGGGNHFIEIDKDKNDNLYLIIHSGSRNLGVQVANYYQNIAIKSLNKDKIQDEKQRIIKEYKEKGEAYKIQDRLKQIKITNIPNDLCYVTGRDMENYLHDVDVCKRYAELNRKTMKNIILDKLNLTIDYEFETIHNYIDIPSKIVRKGAISANKDEIVLIPMNMRDGCLIAKGKGNMEWNCSAPHGAGRIMSRTKAKQNLSIDEYKETMKDIFTTCVNNDTLDEAPMVYKPMQEIINNIQDTVEIIDIIKPIFNFKASE